MFDLRLFINYMMEPYTFYYLIVGLIGSQVFLHVLPQKIKGTLATRHYYVDIIMASFWF
jgi:hypothetical protein